MKMVSSIMSEVIFIPNSPLLLVIVPRPLFFIATDAKANGSLVSWSVIFPEIYISSRPAPVMLSATGLFLIEIIIYLSITE